jgi:hypothetical protein
VSADRVPLHADNLQKSKLSIMNAADYAKTGSRIAI